MRCVNNKRCSQGILREYQRIASSARSHMPHSTEDEFTARSMLLVTIIIVLVLLLLYPCIKMLEYQNEVMARNLKDLDPKASTEASKVEESLVDELNEKKEQ